MRARRLSWTVLIASGLAVVAALAFHRWVTSKARADAAAVRSSETSRLLRESLLAEAEVESLARSEPGSLALTEAKARAEERRARLPVAEAALDFQTRAGVRGQAAVFRPIVEVALTPPVPVVWRDDQLALDADDDAWLLRQEHPVIALRSLERRLVALLLAAKRTPEVCPVAIRVEAALALGTRIDATFAAAVARALPEQADAQASTPSTPEALCRRERLRRLADEALGQRAQKPLPFSVGLFLSPSEYAFLQAAQNPDLKEGLGVKARALMRSMIEANEAIEVNPALAVAITVLLGQLTYEDAVFAHALAMTSAKTSEVPETLLALSARVGGDTRGAREACALAAAMARSLDRPRFLAERVAPFATERWPEEPRRAGTLALLYALAGAAPPVAGVATAAKLMELVALAERADPAAICNDSGVADIRQAVPKATLQRLWNAALDPSQHIR